MTTLHLATLRDQGTDALTSASSALAAQQAQLDCSGVERLTREQLTALFLVNGQQEPATNKDSAWVFQPELCVESPDGSAIFQRRAPLSADADLDTQIMAMRYRKHVEFAVGHSVGVDWMLADGTHDRATCLTTTVIPTWEVPQTTPPTAEDIPDLPALPPPSEMVDPDGWLKAVDGLRIKRTIRANGSVSVDKHDYYQRKKAEAAAAAMGANAPDDDSYIQF